MNGGFGETIEEALYQGARSVQEILAKYVADGAIVCDESGFAIDSQSEDFLDTLIKQQDSLP